MKKISTGFEIVDSASNSLERCICSEDSADSYYVATCGCQCGWKRPSATYDNSAANDVTAYISALE